MFRHLPAYRTARPLSMGLLICLLACLVGQRTFAAPGAGAVLSIRSVSPAPGAEDVSASTTILIGFDRPVVALGAAGAPPPPSPLISTPPLSGHGRWITTSIYSWQARALRAATVYTLSVPAGLRAIDGTRLAGTYSWRFATVRPVVNTVSPDDNYPYAASRPEVRATFNQRMDHAATQAAFSLRDSRGQPVPGTFTWRDRDTTLLFRPLADLQRTASYAASIGIGARSAEGPLAPARTTGWRFSIAPLLRVTGSTPRDREPAADTGQGVTIDFTAPVDPGSAATHVTISPDLPGRYIATGGSNGTSIQLYGNFRPSTAYTVLVKAGLRATAGDTLPASYSFHFVSAPLPPALSFVTGNVASYDAYRPLRLSLQAINPGPIAYTVYRLDRASFIGDLAQQYELSNKLPSDASIVISRTERPATVLNQVTPLEEPLALPGGQLLAPGYYLARAVGLGEAVDYQLLLVTRTNLTIKVAPQQVLIWATDLQSGLPIPGMGISVLSQSGGSPIAGPAPGADVQGAPATGMPAQGAGQLSGHTGPDGTLLLTVGGSAAQQSLIDQSPLVLGDRAGDVAAASPSWSNGIDPSSFGLDGPGYVQPRRLVLYTDRPIYHPGQQVRVRGLVRADDDGQYSLLHDPVSLTLTDTQGRTVARRTLAPDRFGAFATTLTLSQDASLGYYGVNVTSGTVGAQAQVQVAAYRKPTFAVTVTSAHATAIRGQYLDADVQVSYYFGGGVAQARVHWSLLGYDYLFYPDNYTDYSFGEFDPAPLDSGAQSVSRSYSGLGGPIRPGGGGYTLYQGDGTTDAAGRLHLHLRASLPKNRTVQSYTLEANVTDLDRQPVAGNTSVVVYRSGVQIGLQPARQVLPTGATDPIRVVTLQDDGSTPAAGQQVTLAVYRRTYSNQVIRNPDGSVTQQYLPHDTLLRTAHLTTDARGRAGYAFRAATGGEYRLLASARDRYGNPSSSALELYVGGDQPVDWGFQPQGHIRIVTDKPLYHSGEVAHLLIATPAPRLRALISVERGNILAYSTRELPTTSTTLDVPVPSSYLPDTYVGVVVVGGSGAGGPPLWRMGYAHIRVDPRERALQVKVTPATSRIQPGAPLALHIRATDYRGHPVRAQFSLSVVDAAALALAGDPGKGIDLLGQFYGTRPLGVLTANTLNISPEQLLTRHPLRTPSPATADRPSFGPADGTAGTGQNVRAASTPHAPAGGGGAIAIRTQFADTAYWNAAVETDDAGQATLTVGLPDNLTTWQILGQGLTVDTLVGSGTSSVIATKDLTLRPLLPRFLTLGDRALVGATINNTTDSARTVRLQLLLGANGAAPSGQAGARTIRLAAHAEADLTWPVRAAALGNLTIGVRAVDVAQPATNDAVAITLPVGENSTPEDVATAGEAGVATRESVAIPSGIEPNEGGLSVTLEPTLAAGLGVAGDFLRQYPYDSSIDLAARILGQAELGRLPARAAVLEARQRAALRPEIARLLAKLYPMQRGDGGFGWWLDDPYSSPYITLPVVEALTIASSLGYPVRAGVLDRAATYLLGNTRAPAAVNAGTAYDANLQAGIVYALTLYGRGRDVATLGAELFEVRTLLDHQASAQLAVALAARHDPADDARVRTLLADLTGAARLNPTGIHWDQSGYDYGSLDSATGGTATVLDALVRLDPRNPLIPNTVRWLMAARKADAWESTEATANCLQGLVDYIMVSGELNAHYRYSVTRNGVAWGSGSVDAGNLTTRRVLNQPLGPQAQAGSTQHIVIGREVAPHNGTLHYTVRVRYYRPVDRIGPLSEGVSVSRRYQQPTGLSGDKSPTSKSLSGAAVGSTIQVQLTVTAPQDLFYVTLEDPLPAGAEPVDGSLQTTSQLAALNNGTKIPQGTDDLSWYVTHTDLRDDRTVLFLSFLPAGTYRYSYLVHFSTAGTFHTLPTHIAQTYFPEVFGRGSGSYFTAR